MATFNAGSRLKASALEALSVRATPIGAYKSADTTRNSNTTASADPELVVALEPGTWQVRFDVLYSTSAAADFKIGWLPSAGASIGQWWSRWRNGDAVENSGASASHSILRVITMSADMTVVQGIVAGGICVVTSSSTLAVRWAQNTSNASDCVLAAGSYMTAIKIG